MQDNSRSRFPESIPVIGAKRETARQEFSVRKMVLDLLGEKGPLTVPEIAQALGMPADKANWWLMGFVRYNQVKASEKANDDGYFQYSIHKGQ
jgi:predicted transcriptional regulator